MKRTSFVLALVLLLWPAVASAQKLVIVVRHAERADGGGMPPATDPPLSTAGTARAWKLATMLVDAGIKGIFTTEFVRTQETAAPLAKALKLTAQSMPASDTAGLVKKIRSAHPQDVVLIVGHSNTLPEIIKAFGGPAVTIADTEFDNLFVLAPGTPTAFTRIRF